MKTLKDTTTIGKQIKDGVRLMGSGLDVISKVKLLVEPAFKRSITNIFNNDTRFEDEFMNSGNGFNDFIGFQTNLALVSTLVRATEKALENAHNVNEKCAMAASVLGYKKLIANGLKNNLIFTGYPVVGRQGRMQTSGSCLHSPATDIISMCAWDPRIKGLFFYETIAIFPASKFKEFISEVKKLRELKEGLIFTTGF